MSKTLTYLTLLCVVLLLTAAMLACGGGGGETATETDRDDTQPTNTPPQAGGPMTLPTQIQATSAGTTAQATSAATRSVSAQTRQQGPTPIPFPTARPPVANPSAETDREALVAFFNASGGDNWDQSFTWAGYTPLEEWKGVKTNDDGRVVGLDIQTSQDNPTHSLLQKSDLAPLGDLSELRMLTLSHFVLADGLPPEMANLSNLETLTIVDARMNRSIPPVVSRLPNLKRLDLEGNHLTGNIPANLGNLSALEELNLSQNGLTGGIPAELGNLSALEELNLGQNGLTGGIPAELESLHNLFILDLAENQLSGELPSVLASMENLLVIVLSNNQFGGEITLEMDKALSKRLIVNILDNNFTGCVSHVLKRFQFLKRPQFSPRELELPVCEVTHQGDVETMVAIHKALGSPSLSNWLSRAPLYEWDGIFTDREGRVVGLSLSEVKRRPGPIPEELSNLANLEWLFLNANALVGNIPESLGNLSNLRELRLDRNSLTGNIPTSFANLKELRDLNLRNNDMTIQVPGILVDLENLQNFRHADLSSNTFTGCLPSHVSLVKVKVEGVPPC